MAASRTNSEQALVESIQTTSYWRKRVLELEAEVKSWKRHYEDRQQGLIEAEAEVERLRGLFREVRDFSAKMAHPNNYGVGSTIDPKPHWEDSCDHCDLMQAFNSYAREALRE